MDLFDKLYNESIDNGNAVNALLDEGFRKLFPCLHDFIVKRSHNNHKREHGRVTLTAENGQFKISIADPTGQCSFALLGGSIEECMLSMESHAASSAVHWYYWPSRKTGRSSSKKAHTPSTLDGDTNR